MAIQGGATLVSHPPAFANDGKRLLVCAASSVIVLSVSTARPVLQLNGHGDIVTSVVVVPTPGRGKSTANHVWTSSFDGSIRLWDFEIGNLVRTVIVGKPIESMVIPRLLNVSKPETKAQDNIAFISVRWDKETEKGEKCCWTGRVILVNLSSGKRLRGFLAKTSFPQRLVVSPHGNLVGMSDKRKVWIWAMPGGAIEHVDSVKSFLLHHTKACSVIAFDPAETIVAGGDETGRILCWHNFGEYSFRAPILKDNSDLQKDDLIKGGVRGEDAAEACTTFHWHASEVKSLVFSADGTYLFSGGLEGTLVIWQPETGKQQFFPRLGGELSFIIPSPDPSVFAISCRDNAIRFINVGTMTIERSYQGIKPFVPLPNIVKSVYNTRVAFDPDRGRLVLPAVDVSLQFYDAVYDCELFEVQTSPRTNIAGIDNKKGKIWSGPSTFVTQVTFSADGSVMATVDMHLPEEKIGGSTCLKFWNSEPRKLEFVLSTFVDEPHGGEITALVYHPSEHMVVSCSLDGTFRIWVQRVGLGIQESSGKLPAWRCRSVGSYRHKKMLAAAFSPDGSLLAVSAEELVTLWNPYSNGFVTSVACTPFRQNIFHLGFIYNSKYLVGASSGFKPQLIIWHLPTLSVHWSCNVHIEALSMDPNSSNFGVIARASSAQNGQLGNRPSASRKAIVTVLNPENATPTAVWSVQDGIGGALFFGSPNLLTSSEIQPEGSNFDSSRSQSCLLVLTGSRDYVLLDPYKEENEAEIYDQRTVAPCLEGSSAYIAMYGNYSTSNKNSSKLVGGIQTPKPWGGLFNAPSHVLPSLTRISVTFMESLLEKQSDSGRKSL